jgi:hypothetical protein
MRTALSNPSYLAVRRWMDWIAINRDAEVCDE